MSTTTMNHDTIPDYPLLQPETQFYDADSQKISNSIDEQLKRDAQIRKELKKKTIKVLLLGQAESGKSTLLKQFQLLYASKSLDSERPSWRPVVHFNVVKAIRMILDELDYSYPTAEEIQSASMSSSSPTSPSGPSFNSSYSNSPTSSSSSPTAPSSSHSGLRQQQANEPISLVDAKATMHEITLLRTKLLPIVASEKSLAVEFNGGVSVSGGKKGVFVRSGWQALVSSANKAKELGYQRPGLEKPSSVAVMTAKSILGLKEEILELWKHKLVRGLISQGKLRLDESGAYFLDNIERVAEPDYMPSTEDILIVRLQTLGVVEHSIPVGSSGMRYEWKLYDVGGARGQRATWIPFFDDATAIIFLAPISAFDQYLEEDPRVNRIDDSLQLFGSVCANPLLKQTNIVLLLNKADLLNKKLARGVPLKKYITSYGNRANDYKTVSEYFKAHFQQTHRKKDVGNRRLYMHFTSMLDVEATQSIIANVSEAILRQHIESAGLM